MARVDKRVLPSGLVRYQAFYVDGGGKRRAKLFKRRAEAAAWLVETGHDLARGLHTPSSISPTVEQAAAFWIDRCASELRGLRWRDVDFKARMITVCQRADAKLVIGKLKSKAAYRSLRLTPLVLNALREWKLNCPKGDLGLVFPNHSGTVERYHAIIEQGFAPIQMAAGITATKEMLDEDGKPIINNAGMPVMREVARYGMHALRHACASLWIEQNYNPKQIQKLMGHSTIQQTFDIYGHLFNDDEADQRAAESVESRLLGKK